MSKYHGASLCVARHTSMASDAASAGCHESLKGTMCTMTVEGVDLHGLMLNDCLVNKGTATACLFIHGTGSNFYENEWVFPLAETMNKNGIAFISANNRGSHGYCPYPPHGASLEKFGGCVDDINGWISYLKKRGYAKFILLGHSLGTEKIVHYMDQEEQNSRVVGVILLGFSDSYGVQRNHWGSRFDDLMREAQYLIDEGKPETFLTGEWLSHAGVLPKSATSFVDFFSVGSNLAGALPFRSGRLEKYSRITVPILGIVGDQKEWTATPLGQAMDLMQSENRNSTIEQIHNCDHDFTGKDDELCDIVDSFIRSNLETREEG